MSNNNNQLPPPKWSKSTMLKVMEINYKDIFNQIMQSNLDVQEKNKRINKSLETFLLMYNSIMERGLFKKKLV